MKTMTIKNRILLLSILPLVFAISTIMFLVHFELSALGDEQVKDIRSSMMNEKRVILKNYVDIALTSIKSVVASGSYDDAVIKKQVADQLRDILFGESKDGYMFVYDYGGINIVMGPKPELEGKNLYGLQDANGVNVIKDLIDSAKSGGGFLEYSWNKPSKNAEAPKLGFAQAIEQYNWMVGTGFYIDDIDDAVMAAHMEIDKRINRAMMLIAIVGLVLIVLVAFISLFVTGRITKPIQDTVSALNNISHGEGDLTRRLKVYADDEVGQVSISFNHFVEKIHQLVLEIKDSVGDLSESTRQMNIVVTRTNENVAKQKDETMHAATAVHEMAATAEDVAGNASRAAEAAQQADSETASGQIIVEDTIVSISHLSEDVNRATDVINQLSDDAEQIGDVINVIKGIADQTNLLALNAAIEAARAGELGRGFSVVADEVRTLANRTQQSTEEINHMIELLLGRVKEAVGVMNNSRSQGENTVMQAQKASVSLKTIMAAVSTITNMNTQIATAAEEQTVVTDEISRNVQQVADIAEDSSVKALELESTSAELISLENRLAAVVNQFKV
ncbi:methyl-accepting chemotaxis protein [Cognaticolwellia aestuarii]|uniref:methyl-accepting chemotaxis protein n=1 Tax=Cognaticolwellia aestuarii TaxID=329993 RepID=UPI000985F776|nr:methyl-accepting chemotaxis protein [Cognaticolwellia aestuarii]